MSGLTGKQISFIEKGLRSRKMASGYRQELIDHMCSMIEEQLANGSNFDQAYKQCLAEFSEQDFFILSEQSPLTKQKRKNMTLQLASAAFAATLLISFMHIGAQEPPSVSPLEEMTITSSFGLRHSPLTKKKEKHRGIDFKCPVGTPVKSTADGEVISTDSAHGGYGLNIKIKHDGHYTTRYAHLSEIKVNKGDKVKLGQIIGLSGNTGLSTAPHLHYEVIKDGQAVNPEDYFAQ